MSSIVFPLNTAFLFRKNQMHGTTGGWTDEQTDELGSTLNMAHSNRICIPPHGRNFRGIEA